MRIMACNTVGYNQKNQPQNKLGFTSIASKMSSDAITNHCLELTSLLKRGDNIPEAEEKSLRTAISNLLELLYKKSVNDLEQAEGFSPEEFLARESLRA